MKKEMVIYETGAKSVQFNLDPEEETIWVTQAQMAEVFGVTAQNITIHLKKIFQEGELEQERTCKEYLQVQTEGNLSEFCRGRCLYDSGRESGKFAVFGD